MEGVRNAIAGLKGHALSGPHAYEQIPELVERSKQRVVDFFADFNERLATFRLSPAMSFPQRTSRRSLRWTSPPTR
jgi:hypothetical protein